MEQAALKSERIVSNRTSGTRQFRELRATRRCDLWGAALIVMLSVTGAAVSASAAADEVTGEVVDRLVRQLDSDRLSERVAAERQLQSLGPDVLPHLSASGRVRSAAAQDAVKRVRAILERTQAEQSVLPSRVTLKGTNDLREAVRQIAAQTGNTIRTTSLSRETLDLPFLCAWQQASFWDCLATIDAHPQLVVRFRPEDGRLEIVPEAAVVEPVVATSNVGAFRIAVRSVTLRPDFTDRTRNVIRVRYDIAAEPRLRPLFVRVNNADFQLTASDPATSGPVEETRSTSGASAKKPSSDGPAATAHVLAPLDKNARRERPADRPGPVPLSADFVVSRDWSGDRVNLAGRVEIEVATGQEAFVFRNLSTAERVVRRHGGVTVTLDEALFSPGKQTDTGAVRVDLRVAYDQGGPAFESHRTWVYHNDAFLRFSDEAKRWSHSGFDTKAAAEAAVKLSYRFEDVPMDAKGLEFVYVAPTLLLTVPVPIGLSDIPVEASRTSIHDVR